MRWVIPLCLVILAGMSLLGLRSVAPGLSTVQAVFFVLGAVVFAVTQYFPLEIWLRWRGLWYIGLIGLLLVPLVLGTTTRGIAGWIEIGGLFSIQPSQLAIPATLLVVIPLLLKFDGRNLRQLLVILALAAVPAGLIIVEPDLGTTLIFMASVGAALWLSPLDLRYIAVMAGGLVMVTVLSWLWLLQPYQKARITSFIQPNQATDQAGYNARQSLIAVGSGEVTGRGLGQGVQSHLRFLPERQTDFIFASLAEELGFLGSALLVILYGILILTCILIGFRSQLPAGKYLGVATAVMLVAQAGINMGMNMGLLPITGITLPFVSYGGSSIIGLSWLLGLVQGLVHRPVASPHLHIA